MKKTLVLHYLALLFLVGSGAVALFPNQPILFELFNPTISEEIILRGYSFGGMSNTFVSVSPDPNILENYARGDGVMHSINPHSPFPLDETRHVAYNTNESGTRACIGLYPLPPARMETMLAGVCWPFQVRGNVFSMSNAKVMIYAEYVLHLRKMLMLGNCRATKACEIDNQELVFPDPLDLPSPQKLGKSDVEIGAKTHVYINLEKLAAEKRLASEIRGWFVRVTSLFAVIVLGMLWVLKRTHKESILGTIYLFLTGSTRMVQEVDTATKGVTVEEKRREGVLTRLYKSGIDISTLSHETLEQLEALLTKQLQKSRLLEEANRLRISEEVRSLLDNQGMEAAEARIHHEERVQQILTRAGPHGTLLLPHLQEGRFEEAERCLLQAQERARRQAQLNTLEQKIPALPGGDQTKARDALAAATGCIESSERSYKKTVYELEQIVHGGKNAKRTRAM